MSRRKRFGEILIEAGVLNERTLQAALEKQRGTGRHLGQVLEEHGIITERDIAIVLARQFGLQTVRDIAKHSFPKNLLAHISSETALNKLVFPLRLVEKRLTVAMVNPLDMETIDSLAFNTGLTITPCVTTRVEIIEAVNRHYLKPDIGSVRQGSWLVLIVDDQELVRATAMAAMRKIGFDSIEASDGAEGVKLAIRRQPQVVVTDTVMPRMGGQELYRALQSSPVTRGIPVIGMSSKGTPEEEARLLDFGYADFIAKPINQLRLQARVKRIIRMVYNNQLPQAVGNP